MGPIGEYLFRAGLDAFAGHEPAIEKALQDLIDQFDTPVDMPDAALFRYRVPTLSEDGTCSLLDQLDPTPYDLATVLGGTGEATRRKLKLLNLVVARGVMVTGADWVGVYQARSLSGGRRALVKLAYRGRESRAEFPLTVEFAEGSTNSRVGLSGTAEIIVDVAAHRASGGGFYVCDAAVQSEICLPLFDADGKVCGIVDCEARERDFFDPDRQAAAIAIALVAPALLP